MFDLVDSHDAISAGLAQGQAANAILAPMRIAQVNAASAQPDGLRWAPWLGAFEAEAQRQENACALYDSIELAGEAGLYGQIEAAPEIDKPHTGAWAVRGMDVIARCSPTCRYIPRVAKDSERAMTGSPFTCQHHTPQLTWDRCWQSLVDMADIPTTAQAFLELVGPVLNSEEERLLVVSRGGLDGLAPRRWVRGCGDEGRFEWVSAVAATYELSRQRGMVE